jgi:colanic acid biosynthesis protein WcaH
MGAVILPKEDFLFVVTHAPLIAIDLVCRDHCGRVLLGKRFNAPARGTWFVPGGRVTKDERVSSAIPRILSRELGIELSPINPAKFLGVFEHLYPDNFAGVDGVSTHYVVLAYELGLPNGRVLTKDDQHGELKWFSPTELLASEQVHPFTKAYLDRNAANTAIPVKRPTPGMSC